MSSVMINTAHITDMTIDRTIAKQRTFTMVHEAPLRTLNSLAFCTVTATNERIFAITPGTSIEKYAAGGTLDESDGRDMVGIP